MRNLLSNKIFRVCKRKIEAFAGRFYPIEETLDAMECRPFELHLELTNLCNANCIFCPYQFQQRKIEFMSDEIFEISIRNYISIGGGSVGLTPIVGDALIDKKFIKRVKYLRAFPQIDRIWVTTNAILLHKHGIDEVLGSGLTSITISTAGFEERMYNRVYRSQAYKRMLLNVKELVRKNRLLEKPIPITISLRPNRSLKTVIRDKDFQAILAYKPKLDFAWSYTSANGKITKKMLYKCMKLRTVSMRNEPCAQLYNGPIVLANGDILACSCVAAMDATEDLKIGSIIDGTIEDAWSGYRLKDIRNSFSSGELNPTCRGCDMYRNLELYRLHEGRLRAKINLRRNKGEIIKRPSIPDGYFSGG